MGWASLAVFVGHYSGYRRYRYFLTGLSVFEPETQRHLLVAFNLYSNIPGSFSAAFFFHRDFGQRSLGIISNRQSGTAEQAHNGAS